MGADWPFRVTRTVSGLKLGGVSISVKAGKPAGAVMFCACANAAARQIVETNPQVVDLMVRTNCFTFGEILCSGLVRRPRDRRPHQRLHHYFVAFFGTSTPMQLVTAVPTDLAVLALARRTAPLQGVQRMKSSVPVQSVSQTTFMFFRVLHALYSDSTSLRAVANPLLNHGNSHNPQLPCCRRGDLLQVYGDVYFDPVGRWLRCYSLFRTSASYKSATWIAHKHTSGP